MSSVNRDTDMDRVVLYIRAEARRYAGIGMRDESDTLRLLERQLMAGAHRKPVK